MSALGIYDLGTITVGPGDTLVPGTGVAWATIAEFDLFVAGGACAFVDAVTDLVGYAELRLKGAWRGPALVGAPYQIIKFPTDWTRTQQELRDLLNLLRLGARVYVVPADEAAPDEGIGEPGDTAIQVTQWPPMTWVKSEAGAWAPVTTNAYLFPAGTEAAPSIAFAGDHDTGMWSPAAHTIAWSTGGVERMRLQSNGALLLGGAAINLPFGVRVNVDDNVYLVSGVGLGLDAGVWLYAVNDANNNARPINFFGSGYKFHSGGIVTIANGTPSTSRLNGALIVDGGAGFMGDVNADRFGAAQQWAIVAASNTLGVADGQEKDIDAGMGLALIVDFSGGGCALYLLVAGEAVLVAANNANVLDPTAAPDSGRAGISYNFVTERYRVKNNKGVSAEYRILGWRLF